MSKLGQFSRHCFEVAEKISQQSDLKLSKGFIDIPGLADAQGRSNTLEYPKNIVGLCGYGHLCPCDNIMVLRSLLAK